MADVVKLSSYVEKKPDTVFACVCGNQLFYVNASFDKDKLLLECRSCNEFVLNMSVKEEYGG